MRKKIVAGNWKMNNGVKETSQLIRKVKKSLANLELNNVRVIVAPSFVNLAGAITWVFTQ